VAPPPVITGATDPGVPVVTRDELDRAVRRMAAKNTAPGPDGVPGSSLGERLRGYFNEPPEPGLVPPRRGRRDY